MRIIKAIVDELPKSASRCRAAKRTWNQDWAMESVYCELNFQTVLLDTRDFVKRRCPNCPLVEEAGGSLEWRRTRTSDWNYERHGQT